jgi:hypothetical protein
MSPILWLTPSKCAQCLRPLAPQRRSQFVPVHVRHHLEWQHGFEGVEPNFLGCVHPVESHSHLVQRPDVVADQVLVISKSVFRDAADLGWYRKEEEARISDRKPCAPEEGATVCNEVISLRDGRSIAVLVET